MESKSLSGEGSRVNSPKFSQRSVRLSEKKDSPDKDSKKKKSCGSSVQDTPEIKKRVKSMISRTPTLTDINPPDEEENNKSPCSFKTHENLIDDVAPQ